VKKDEVDQVVDTMRPHATIYEMLSLNNPCVKPPKPAKLCTQGTLLWR